MKAYALTHTYEKSQHYSSDDVCIKEAGLNNGKIDNLEDIKIFGMEKKDSIRRIKLKKL